MKKLKQLSLILLLSVGLFSCEAEKADPELINENLQGQQIFRFEADGQTRVTDKVTVTSSGTGVQLTATFKDAYSEYKDDVLTIYFSKLEVGSFISSLGNGLNGEFIGLSTASFKHHNVNWSYSTDNVEPTTNPLGVQTGSLTITNINTIANYFEGEFEYTLYAPKSANPNGTVVPLQIKSGYFQYIKY